MSKHIRLMPLSALILAILVASGCSAPKPAGLSDQQVTSLTENILKAIDSDDYQKFTQDFSEKMDSVFTEAQFEHLRSLLQTASGSYISLGTPSMLNNQGYAVYRFTAKYEKENVYVTITFLVNGLKVEGLLFDSVNLRKANP